VKRLVWVIGGRGMLGSAVRRVARMSEEWTTFETPAIPWGVAADVDAAVTESFRRLREQSRRDDSDWSIVWAAGAANVASSDDETDAEARQFRRIFDILTTEIDGDTRGSVFFASSVGALYGGAASPPFTEHTPIAATSPYGRLKIELEKVIADFSATTGTASVIGRITNLYGPGQRLDKAQGLISHLLLSRYGPTPASIYVPLGTVRDYFYVDDCARLVLDSLLELTRANVAPGTVVTKLFGSGQGVSISSLLGYLRYLTKGTPSVSIGQRPSAKFQAPDLRIRSVVWPHLDRREKTPLAAGFHSTMIDVLKSLQK
jgi:UDP-glucose 4-epimerase